MQIEEHSYTELPLLWKAQAGRRHWGGGKPRFGGGESSTLFLEKNGENAIKSDIWGVFVVQIYFFL